ncbi:hypothetical protein ACIBP6_08275 [Nonomuraea terrae]|uniref:hypothetical protein n=1 Tax=Nonomuraea terrae TaxID=2530383 RepID=UPI00379587FE
MDERREFLDGGAARHVGVFGGEGVPAGPRLGEDASSSSECDKPAEPGKQNLAGRPA